jgi:phage shock protein E
MSRRLLTLLTLALVALFAVAACDSTSDTATEAPGAHKVSAADAVALIESENPPVVIDVRTPEEYASGHVAGAINMDVNGADFSSQISELDPDQQYLVYCRSGNRSAQAAAQMEAAGIADIADGGGLSDLVSAGAPVE